MLVQCILNLRTKYSADHRRFCGQRRSFDAAAIKFYGARVTGKVLQLVKNLKYYNIDSKLIKSTVSVIHFSCVTVRREETLMAIISRVRLEFSLESGIIV